MEIQGKIAQILPLASGVGQASGKAWSKQEYILETLDSQYPKKICFNLWGDKIQQFDLKEGEEVTVQIDIESREYNGRWYTDVRAWRVDRGLVSLAADQPMPASQPIGATTYQAASASGQPIATGATQQIANAPIAPTPADNFVPGDSGDDLPF